MGTLSAYCYVSLDGVMGSPETWTTPFFCDGLVAELTEQLTGAEAMILGRQTYEEFSAFWPAQGDEIAFSRINNEIAKVVVSDTLESPRWANTRRVRRDDVARLKSSTTGRLHITGSATVVRGLLRDSLLDNLSLIVFPIILGDGKRLFSQSMCHSAYKYLAAYVVRGEARPAYARAFAAQHAVNAPAGEVGSTPRR